MRFTVRLLALILLLAIGTFAYFGSRTTMADGNPCFEGCARGYENCTGKCKLDMSCRQKCERERTECHAKCEAADLPEAPPEN